MLILLDLLSTSPETSEIGASLLDRVPPPRGTKSLRAGLLSPGSHPPGLNLSSHHPLSSVRSPHGPEHPDSGFNSPSTQHNRAPCKRSTNRRNTPCHGFHDKSR